MRVALTLTANKRTTPDFCALGDINVYAGAGGLRVQPGLPSPSLFAQQNSCFASGQSAKNGGHRSQKMFASPVDVEKIQQDAVAERVHGFSGVRRMLKALTRDVIRLVCPKRACRKLERGSERSSPTRRMRRARFLSPSHQQSRPDPR